MVRLMKAAAEAEAAVSGSAAAARCARVTATNGALRRAGGAGAYNFTFSN